MIRFNLKASCRQLILLISCLAVALPSIAGPVLCQDCDCCISTQTDKGPTESPCCCGPAPVEERSSCYRSKATETIRRSCHCQDTPQTPQPCLEPDKTETLVSSLMLCQQLGPSSVPTAAVGTGWCHTKISSSNDPELLRSVILLI